MEAAHSTELEWAEVCSGTKFQKREMVQVLGFLFFFLHGGEGWRNMLGKIILLQNAE